MSEFKRPNPDVYHRTDVAWEQSFVGGILSIEVWEYDGRQQWVLVCDGGTSKEHAAMTDAMAGMMLRVMRDDE